MEYNQKIVISKIRQYRELKNMSQKQLSKITGLSLGYIGDIECGRNENGVLPLDTICKISEALGVTLDNLAANNLTTNVLKSDIEDELTSLISSQLDLLQYDDLIFFERVMNIFK